MPELAMKDGQSLVECTDGVQGSVCNPTPFWHWDSPLVSETDQGSSTVFVNGYGVVREDDLMAAHPDGVPCTPVEILHTPFLNTFSSSVYVEGKRVARKGDTFNGGTPFNHIISTGSANVFVG